MKSAIYSFLIILLAFQSCEKDEPNVIDFTEWNREENPVLRDSIINENYQVASDAHVFMDGDSLKMIYTGDENGKPAIKLANANAIDDWTPSGTLLGAVGPSGLDSHKETGFYRKTANGKHQIYYIGYDNEATYKAQIFLAEADALNGQYTQMNAPVVAKGLIAGKSVYCMTSPSVVEHQGTLYMNFIGWDNSPNNVTEVWVMGATSKDNGHTWNDFQIVETRIGMEGQVTKVNENEFVAVSTGDFGDKEAIFYSTASHPFGPWTESENPILVQAGPPFEKDEIIAPHIFIDPATNEEILFYTGADYAKGWWIMMAKE
jgi:predicted cupin superfamily sugar epimerase